MTRPFYRDPDAPVGARVRDLLGRMTLREKVGQVNQRLYGWDAYERTPGEHGERTPEGHGGQMPEGHGERTPEGHDGRAPEKHGGRRPEGHGGRAPGGHGGRAPSGGRRLTDAFRAEVAAHDGMGALYGLQRADPWSGVGFADGITAADGARVSDDVQRHVVENTRLGVPVLFVEEVPHGHQALDGTVLPVNLAVGATWDPGLYEAAAEAAGAELRARGGHVALVSALDLVRDPRWGRAEECFGEDPHLAARFTGALVRGMRRAGAAVVLKHFAGQGATVGGRNSAATELGPRELHEIHLAAARAGVRAGAAGVMAAYNELDGLPCVAHRDLLTGLLREQWGFEGIVMADGGAVDRLVRLTGDPVSAGAMALAAGCDLSLWDASYSRLAEAVTRGLVPEAALDTAVARVLALKFRLGLFERPYTSGRPVHEPPLPMREVSERIARASLVLLAHDGHTLPLAPAVRRVAVLGPHADGVAHQLGDYTAPQRPGAGVSVLAGIRAAVPEGVEVTHAAGCAPTGDDPSGLPEAVALAAGAQVAVLVLGGSSARDGSTAFDANGAARVGSAAPSGMTCGEGVDLAELTLPEGQLRLIEAVAATGTPVVVVLVQGRPHALPDLSGTAGAVLSAWYPGPWGGRAVADVLLGRAEPQGRLPVSVPRSASQLPVFYNGKDHGYRGYVDQPASARHPFGHGLSYTTVSYGAPRLSRGSVSPDAPALTCTVAVTNTGDRPVSETVQLYVRRLSGGSSWPRTRELRGFTRVALRPGETAEAVFAIDADTLASVTRDLTPGVEAGELLLETGPSSDATRAVPLTVGP